MMRIAVFPWQLFSFSDPGLWQAWIAEEICSFKLDYTLLVSQRTSILSKSLMSSFVANCLRLYHLSLRLERDLPVTERRSGDDAAILAAMGCIRLFYAGEKHALLRSAAILEELLSTSKHNYDALLLIVRLYVCLGAITRAFDHYCKLDIKNIQNLTFPWVLLTRISTVLPTSPLEHRFQPIEELGQVQNYILKFQEQKDEWELRYLARGEYVNLLSQVKLSENSIKSFSTLAMSFESHWIEGSMAEALETIEKLGKQSPKPPTI